MRKNRSSVRSVVSRIQPLLWSREVKKIDIRNDRVYIIHQVLSFGDLKDIREIFRIYSMNEIKDVFLRYPKKIYQRAVFYFVKNFILGLKDIKLNEDDYVKTLS